MVRPDEIDRQRRKLIGLIPCCVGLAGVSPAAVSAGAPRSRLRVSGEIPPSEWSVESPQGGVCRLGREAKHRAPMLTREPCSLVTYVNRKVGWPSRSCHGEGNRLHPQATGGVQAVLGVWRGARCDSPTRNRRGPPRQLTSSEGRPYTPKVKWVGAGRDSEGLIVPLMASQDNGVGGKGPRFGHAWRRR